MRALMYVDEKKMELQELPMPEGEVILRVLGCTVCGTDLKTFLHGHPYFKPPTILGHEFYGRVEKAPADSSFAPGDYVVAAPYGACGRSFAKRRIMWRPAPSVNMWPCPPPLRKKA